MISVPPAIKRSVHGLATKNNMNTVHAQAYTHNITIARFSTHRYCSKTWKRI